MSIPVVRIVRSLRYYLNDMQGISISDYELIEAINHAASLLYSRLGEKFVSSSLKKHILIVPDDGHTVLPVDFVRVHQVGMGDGEVAIPTTYQTTASGTYRIIGTEFYAPEGAYNLEYYYIPVRVNTLSDELDVPLSMSPYIEQIALAMYARDAGKAEQLATVCAQTLGGREISHIDGQGPTQVLGGSV